MGNFVRTVGELGASMNLRIIHLLTNLYSTSQLIGLHNIENLPQNSVYVLAKGGKVNITVLSNKVFIFHEYISDKNFLCIFVGKKKKVC